MEAALLGIRLQDRWGPRSVRKLIFQQGFKAGRPLTGVQRAKTLDDP